jgi:hypothetical protein
VCVQYALSLTRLYIAAQHLIIDCDCWRVGRCNEHHLCKTQVRSSNY